MLHEPERYPNPLEFSPERFLDQNPQEDPRTMCFGFGRRICPGLQLADVSVWISCAMSLAVFDITKKLDENGIPIVPVPKYTDGTIRRVLVCLIIRSFRLITPCILQSP